MHRRRFIQLGAAGAAVAAGGGLVSNWYGLDRPHLSDPGTEGERIVPSICELCFWKCGILAHVRGGRVTKITGNPAHPLSRGRLCPRGAGGTGSLYDPDRLRQPLLRQQARGEDVFVPVSWDDALDRVAGAMQKIKAEHGPEAFALFQHGAGASWFVHLFKAYGSPNVAAPSFAQCRGPRDVAFNLTYGEGVGSPERVDMENARCVVLLGSHLGENMHNTQVQDFASAIARRATIIVVDPRFSTAAGKAQHYLPIRPGTDLALLLAWMNVLVEEELYDKEYVDRLASGFPQLKAHLADKTPEWAYPRTGLRPEQIRATARAMAAARPAVVVHPGRHVVWNGDDTQRSRAVAILAALLGSWGRQGGYLLHQAMPVPKGQSPAYPKPARPGADRPKPSVYPLADETLASGICEATIPGSSVYDVKAWMVYGTNLVSSLPQPEKTKKALQALDFMVAIDVLPAEITGWADVVLPEASYLERWDDLHAPPWREPFIALRQEVVPPLEGTKPGWWIARELGRRLGLEAFFPWSDPQEYLRRRLEAGGYDFDQLAATGIIRGPLKPVTYETGASAGFATPSGKIELYSTDLAAAGFDPMPVYTPPEDPPSGSFRLLIGRVPVHTFGRTTNNRLLCEIVDENEVWVAASAARSLSLESGDRVLLVNQDGAQAGPVRVKVTERIRPDAVFLAHGFGHGSRRLRFAYGKGADDSALMTRVKLDPVMGGTGTNVNFVTLRRA